MELLLWLYALLHFHLVLSSCNANHLCPHDESVALLQFQQIFTINNETMYGCHEIHHPKTMFWNQSTDCCTWDGVTCNRFTGRVIGLDLSCSQLSGTIQPNSSLLHLSHLQKLDLASNDISGQYIFHEIASLTRLMDVNLSYSFSFGSLRPEISLLSNLTKLRVLSLAGTNLSSEVPMSLLNLSTSLVHLDLSSTGLSGELPENVLHLPNLETLLLSYNRDLTGHLPNSNWSSSGFLKNLDLFSTSFSGEVPDSIGYAKSLNYLVLASCHFFGSIPNSIGNLSHIIKIDLVLNNFRGPFPSSISNLEQLSHLYLSANNFGGPIPSSISNLEQLSHLDLSANNFGGPIPSSISNLEQLIHLDLSANNFKSEIPDVFMHLKKLSFLNLGQNNLFGEFPSSAVNLPELRLLDFHMNSLTGPLPQNAHGLQKLTYLYLSNNSLTGTLPSWLFSLPSLQFIMLDDNQLTGKMHDFKSQTLNAISMKNNKLSGPIPRSLSRLAILDYLFLSSNNLSGVVELSMFPSSLVGLDISYNNLTWSNDNNANLTFPVLMNLRLSSCETKEIPSFIRYSNNLQFLDLSENKLHGRIPDWFRSTEWDNLVYLDFSHNFLTVLDQLPWKSLGYLRLKSNLLHGTLPSHICNLGVLQVLDLSANNLTGTIPPCFGNFSTQLMVLDLRRNHFHGTIPTTFAESNELKNIALNGNQLEGSLPQSLANCQQLEVLDLGNNNFTGEFPFWLEYLRELRVVILNSNQFQGPISRFKTELPFPNVRIFDISYNEFTGKFPENLFKSFKAMMSQDEEVGEPRYMETKAWSGKNLLYPDLVSLFSELRRGGNFLYRDSLSLVIKGKKIEIARVIITLTTIDFSSNKFDGEIPYFIGNLNSLKLLNLSHNKLQGHIPSSLGDLRKLEALDLSSNQLEGEIPWQLTKVTSLEVLNLTENHLTGHIPQGNQFGTFENSSYTGNLALCGFPLTKACEETETSQPSPPSKNEQEDAEHFMNGFSWKSVVVGYGCGAVFGLAIGCAMFLTGKPKWFIEIVESTFSMRNKSRKRYGRRRQKRT